jgi:hypothetical protein
MVCATPCQHHGKCQSHASQMPWIHGHGICPQCKKIYLFTFFGTRSGRRNERKNCGPHHVHGSDPSDLSHACIPLQSGFLGYKWLVIGWKTCPDTSELVSSGLDEWKLDWARLVWVLVTSWMWEEETKPRMPTIGWSVPFLWAIACSVALIERDFRQWECSVGIAP